MHYIVYKITNKLNGKIYIGKHKTSDIFDDYMGSSEILKSDIKKFGIKNFVKEILFDFEDYDSMNNKERELVNEEFVKREDTYNLNLGGSGGWLECNRRGENNKSGQYKSIHEQCKNDPELRKEFNKRISTALKEFHKKHPDAEKGENNGMFGKRHNIESRKLMSEKRKGELNGSFGTFWITNESLRKSIKWRDKSSIPSGWKIGRKMYK